jgi:hypothetical protein
LPAIGLVERERRVWLAAAVTGCDKHCSVGRERDLAADVVDVGGVAIARSGERFPHGRGWCPSRIRFVAGVAVP